MEREKDVLTNSEDMTKSSHHRSHHHYSHHNRHKKHFSANKEKTKEFFKKHRSGLVNAASCMVSVVLLIILALNFNNISTFDKKQGLDVTDSTIKIETSIYGEEVCLADKTLIDFMKPNSVLEAETVFNYFNNGKRSAVYPWSFTYDVYGLPNGVKVQGAELNISENKDFAQNQTHILDLDSTNVNVYNLKTGVKYYYKLNLALSNGCNISTIGEFDVAKTPRIMKIDGAINTRDIGGYDVAENKRIRQGLLYRGTEIDGAVKEEYCLTTEGKKEMLSVLNIRYDMDLRAPTDNKNGFNALGDDIAHKYYNAPMYNGVFSEKNKDIVKSIFKDLAKKENYPMYLHCTYGRDRTGTVVYLLGGLLGMSDADLTKEYELSAFCEIGINREDFSSFVNQINMLDGATTQEKIEKWLLSIGVTHEEISCIKEIFLADKN